MLKYTEKLLDGLDPKNSPKDRRILYQTTGIRLDASEIDESLSGEKCMNQTKETYPISNTAIRLNHVIQSQSDSEEDLDDPKRILLNP